MTLTSLTNQSLHFKEVLVTPIISIKRFENFFRSCNFDGFAQKISLLFKTTAFARYLWMIVQTLPKCTSAFVFMFANCICILTGSTSFNFLSSVLWYLVLMSSLACGKLWQKDL